MNAVKKEGFSKSIGYLFISQGLIKVLGLFYSLYLINKPSFGDEGNAIYLSGYQIFIFMLTFSSIGVPNAVSNIIAQTDNHNLLNKVFKVALVLYVSIACVSSITLFVLSDFIADKVIGIEIISYNLKILAPIIIVTTLESVYTGFFNGIRQMKITAQIQFIEQFFKTFFTIMLVEVLSRITTDSRILSIGATLAVSSSIIISFIISYAKKKNIEVFSKEFVKSDFTVKDIVKKLLYFSVPISIGAMLVGINKNSDSFTIMNILADKIGKNEAQKIYGIIASKIDVLIVLPLAFNITFSTALIPNISEAKYKKDNKSIKLYIENAIFMSLAIGIASSMGLCFFAEEIFNLLFSNSKSGIELLKLASFTIIFSVLTQTFSGILQGFGKNKITVLATFSGMIIKLVFNFVLVKHEFFLEKGIIISTILSNIIMSVILFNEIRKNIKFSFKRYFIILFMASGIMIIFIKIFKEVFSLFLINSKIIFIISMFMGIVLYFVEILGISRVFGLLKKRKIYNL
ncbi:MAG: polysaccharide biosynthesis C-terminal domain-containing protein [Clostridia bacterium]|nr:polysaccharide biosynthesis C-terminal domain-containing protein [Clostridia bacterium]